MKALSLVLGMSLLTSVSFAQISITDRIGSISCTSTFEQKATKRVSSVTNQKGEVLVAVLFQDALQQKNLEIFNILSADLDGNEAENSLLIKLANKENTAEIEIDYTGASTLVVNGIAQDILKLECEAGLKEKK